MTNIKLDELSLALIRGSVQPLVLTAYMDILHQLGYPEAESRMSIHRLLHAGHITLSSTYVLSVVEPD